MVEVKVVSFSRLKSREALWLSPGSLSGVGSLALGEASGRVLRTLRQLCMGAHVDRAKPTARVAAEASCQQPRE